MTLDLQDNELINIEFPIHPLVLEEILEEGIAKNEECEMFVNNLNLTDSKIKVLKTFIELWKKQNPNWQYLDLKKLIQQSLLNLM
jgi:hypothetical protein